jgi:PAS domain S-box-containing protein
MIEGNPGITDENCKSERNDISELVLYSTSAVALFDQNLRCQALSAALGKMFGLQTAENAGKPLRQIVLAEATPLETAFEKCWQSGEPLLEVEMVFQLPVKPEKRVWLVNLYPIKNNSGRVHLIAATFSDVTKWRRAEEKLYNLRAMRRTNHQRKTGHREDYEFAVLSKRTIKLVERSTELLKTSMDLRSHAFEIQMEAGLAHFELFLAGSRRRELPAAVCQPQDLRLSVTQPKRSNGNGIIASRPSLRERQILCLLADGKSSKEIGSILKISPRTVESYRARIMLKLDLHSTAGLVRYAIRENLVRA